MTVTATIGLGANQGDRAGQLAAARDALTEAGRLTGVSSIYETQPLGPSQAAFLNQVVELETALDAQPLLERLQHIEEALGRDRESGGALWGPRTIDLDVLLFGDAQIRTEHLEVPHPELLRRSFVLVPLLELSPGRTDPRDGRAFAAALAALRGTPSWSWIRPYRADAAGLPAMAHEDGPRAAQARCLEWRARGLSIGFVPTMGFLHQGHLSLIRQARAENDRVVVSIFVNPLQFGPDEDLERYPRDPEGDAAACRGVGADLLFTSTPAAMYPDGFSTYVVEEQLGQALCGAGRPGHFRGVTTVVTKLFNLAQPTRAYFGRKDAQQAAIVRRMVADLDLPLEVVVLPIVREGDGLALSSRNAYLTPPQRATALAIPRALAAAAAAFADGQRSAARLIAVVRDALVDDELTVEYVALVDPRTLGPRETADRGDLIALAATVGTTRLIDNRVLGEDV